MVGGRLVLTGYGGGVNALDPATGARRRRLSRRDRGAADCGPGVDKPPIGRESRGQVALTAHRPRP